MPAVVRGGRRQGACAQPRKATPRAGARGRAPRNAPRNASGTPGKLAAFGRLDLSPRAVMISLVAGVAVPIGTYAGSCNLIDGDIAELLPGEVSGVICTKSGDGQEIGVFSEGGKLVLKQGVVHKDDSGVSRTSFVELKKI